MEATFLAHHFNSSAPVEAALMQDDMGMSAWAKVTFSEEPNDFEYFEEEQNGRSQDQMVQVMRQLESTCLKSYQEHQIGYEHE